MRGTRIVLQTLKVAFCGVVLGLAGDAGAAEIHFVTSTADGGDTTPGDDVCDADPGPGQSCTLRAAIEESNALPNVVDDPDRIHFAIPGDGPHVIAPSLALPIISEQVVIDGYTQPLSLANTLNDGFDADLRIVLDGGGGGPGLYITGPRVEVRGLEIRGMGTAITIEGPAFETEITGCRIVSNGSGVLVGGSPLATATAIGLGSPPNRNLISGNAVEAIQDNGDQTLISNNLIGTDASGLAPNANAVGLELFGTGVAVAGNTISGNLGDGIRAQGLGGTIAGNLIGTDPSGTRFLANQGNGIRLTGQGYRVGGDNPSSQNVISGNDLHGILLQGSGNQIWKNHVGAGRGFQRIGNGSGGGTGIAVENGSDNFIGDFDPARGNVIVNSQTGPGVSVRSTGIGPALRNRILSNRIFDNASSGYYGPGGIDLGADGVTENDFQDNDPGPNGLQNAPVLDEVLLQGSETVVRGSLDSDSSQLYTLQFFSNLTCDASGRGPGRDLLGTSVPLGVGSFEVTVGAARGPAFSATATDEQGNTSEFSNCLELVGVFGVDLALKKTASVSESEHGETILYTTTLSHLSGAAATHVVVRDPRPAGFASYAPVSGSPSQGSWDEPSGLWDVGDLAPGAVATLEVEAVVAFSAPPGVIAGEASIESFDGVDPNTLDNQDDAPVLIRTGANVMIRQQPPVPIGPLEGETVTFTIEVESTGPDDATNVTVANILPPEFSYVTGGGDGLRDLATFDLLEGEVRVFVVEAVVDPITSPGIATNRALIRSFDQIADDDVSDNLFSVDVGFGGAADLGFVDGNCCRYRNQGPQVPEHWQVVTEFVTPALAQSATCVSDYVSGDDDGSTTYGTYDLPSCDQAAPDESCCHVDGRDLTCTLAPPAAYLDDFPIHGYLEQDFYCWGASTEWRSRRIRSDLIDPFPENNVVFSGPPIDYRALDREQRIKQCLAERAAQNTSLAPHLDSLRDFRDEVLMASASGRAFVDGYYWLSAQVAGPLERHESLRFVTRMALTPVVLAIEHRGMAGGGSTLAMMGLVGLTAHRRRQRRATGCDVGETR